MLLVSIFIFDNILWPSGVSTGCSFSETLLLIYHLLRNINSNAYKLKISISPH